MYIRYLGFVLLIWAPGRLCAQSCSAPSLDGGFFAPKQEVYAHETNLTFTCNDGRKLTVKGWWATSTCDNGKWSPQPQCIEENDCIPPNTPNGKYFGIQKEWYKEGSISRVTCDRGYEPRHQVATARCIRGTWSSLPICEKSISACGEPPKVPHAVIIHQDYQEVFAVDSEVQYECEDGYTIEGGDTKKSVFCIYGNWTEGPTCRPGTQHDGSADGGTGGGHTTSAASGTQPGGSSTTSDSGPAIRSIDHCGEPPNVPNGEVLQRERMSLKYQCGSFYKLHGPETVVCYSDGTWSTLPICKDAFCVIKPGQYADLILSGNEYVKEGESTYIYCIYQDYFRSVQCKNGELTVSPCCRSYDLRYGRC